MKKKPGLREVGNPPSVLRPLTSVLRLLQLKNINCPCYGGIVEPDGTPAEIDFCSVCSRGQGYPCFAQFERRPFSGYDIINIHHIRESART